MKFFQKILIWLVYCVGLIHGVSYIIRIGKRNNHPVLPGQVWSLPGVGDVIIVRDDSSYVYYEAIDDREQTWCCRLKTFREHAVLTAGRIRSTPIVHLVDSQSNNIIQLKKDTTNDPV